MHAEILTIGDELCRGEIVDTNSSWLAARLWEIGVEVRWMTSCRDDRRDMRQALEQAAARAPLIVVSGGLGPTEDDLTVDVIADFAGTVPEEHGPSRERMENRFAKLGFALTPNNMRQVRVPKGSEPLLNPAGLAPGFGVSVGGTRIYAMPGVPREMQAIFEAGIAPRLAEMLAGGERIAKRVYRVFGKGESHVDHALAGLVDGVAGATVHYQVLFPETLVKLVVRDADLAAAEARLATLDAGLRARLGELVYGTVDEPLPLVVGRALRAAKQTLVVAESCTGGMLGSIMTEVPGSSDYFLGGFIVYRNDMKERELGVRPETLRAHGAVSKECVEEMARGARERAGATWGVAISGVAGPDGGTPEKPVGTVHIAVSGPREAHRLMTWPGTRDQVRRLSCYWAMAMVLREARHGG